MFYGLFVWFDGFASVWVNFHLLVLLSMSTRGMFSYLWNAFYGSLYHKFRVSKIFERKNIKWP